MVDLFSCVIGMLLDGRAEFVFVDRGEFLGTRNEERGMGFYDMLDTRGVVVPLVVYLVEDEVIGHVRCTACGMSRLSTRLLPLRRMDRQDGH